MAWRLAPWPIAKGGRTRVGNGHDACCLRRERSAIRGSRP